MAKQTTEPPLWLLDVDGVLNALADTAAWPADQWLTTHAAAMGSQWPIRAATPVLDFIRQTKLDGSAEIQWHTTWQHDTVDLAQQLTLPHFEVAEAPEFTSFLDSGYAVGQVRQSNEWWKLGAVQRALESGRRVIWTDDDIEYERRSQGSPIDGWQSAYDVLFLAPYTDSGLTPAMLDQIRDFCQPTS